jgi:hypothetical protein
MLRILRKLLVLVEQLRRITARPAIDPVELVSATRIAISATAAAIVTIIIQGKSS